MRYLSLLRRGRAAVRLGPVVTLIALLISGASRPADAQRGRRFDSGYRSRIDTSFAFDRNGTVTVRSANGEIVITGSSGNQVHVHAVSDDDNLRLDVSSARMTLETTGWRHGGDTRFEVSVPYGVRVIVHSQSGDVSVRGTRGEVEAHAQSGDVQVDDVAARLDVNTLSGGVTATNVTGDVQVVSTSGDVKITDLRGSVDAQTVSGEIDLRGVTSRMVRAKTTSGDVTLDGLIDPAGRYELGAHSGDIRLHLQRDASAQITVATWSGSINPDFPITLKPGEHGIGSSNTKRFTFEIGGGAARITAETFSGDITIASNGRGASDRR
jgi:DUF4097 and DUF4098 domain-containing protein YvlB